MKTEAVKKAKSKPKAKEKLNLRSLFLGLQKSMIENLNVIRENVEHAPSKGEGAENEWIIFLRTYLPKRYCVDRAKVIDHHGNQSDAIDVVIYDQQYTPFVLNKNSIKLIPAESVYAVFEAKQEISKSNIEYAGKKIQSVRKLMRTTAPVVDKGVVKAAPQLFEILGGFLCLDGTWVGKLSECDPFKEAMGKLKGHKFLNIGCVLKSQSFTVTIENGTTINYSADDETLIYFFLKLTADLQKLGTVRPIDINKYIDSLNSQ
jgi:hypothetical protein